MPRVKRGVTARARHKKVIVAAKAGLKSGDVIEKVNGEAINDAKELSRKIAGLKPGAKVDLAYLRGGKADTATVKAWAPYGLN